MKLTSIATLLCMMCVCAASAQYPSQHRLANSMQAKLDHLDRNATLAHPDPTPTVMTEEEVNDYVASGRVKMPEGVKKVVFQGQSGVLTSVATVDFDEINGGQRASSPLLSLFNGTHNVLVESDAVGNGGEAKVHIRNVTIDGITVPRMALEFFVSKYLTPKYPNVGMDSTFKLPDKIDTAIIGYHKLTVVQR